jgi:pimeloyl-ACP methyl ester carboxylesterase
VAARTPVESGSFRWNGRELAYESWGTGDQVVVLLHGLLLDRTMYRALSRRLAARGYRVVLPDLLGHGASDKPEHASEYRMDTYGEQVVGLLDHLGLDQVVLGGASMGANVSLLVAASQPARLRALVLEMPVLERAVPAAAMTFVPLLLALHYAAPLLRLAPRCVPARTRVELLDTALAAVRLPPEVTAAILHGILVGHVAPTIDQRRRIEVPALLIAHGGDLIHPFSDARGLAEQLPTCELVRARSPVELRFRPERLSTCIEAFLDFHAPIAPVRRAHRSA